LLTNIPIIFYLLRKKPLLYRVCCEYEVKVSCIHDVLMFCW
jgi:hypothetical protein